jgi:Predicted UDP-glucose 6-dehydrogenase
MNDYQKQRFGTKIITTLFNTVSAKKIALLGWAFKKDTNDTRESASIYVADQLLEDRAHISVYDPKVNETQMLTDLDYLGTRAPDDNHNYLQAHGRSLTKPCEGCPTPIGHHDPIGDEFQKPSTWQAPSTKR